VRTPAAPAAAFPILTLPFPASADALDGLLHGRTRVVELAGGRVVAAGAACPTVLLPGSFNPLHEGHTALLAAAVAAAGPGAVGGFELSVSNADKGVLPLAEVERRAAQFAPAAQRIYIYMDRGSTYVSHVRSNACNHKHIHIYRTRTYL